VAPSVFLRALSSQVNRGQCSDISNKLLFRIASGVLLVTVPGRSRQLATLA